MQCTGHCSELDGAVPSQDYCCSAVGKYLRNLFRYCHGSPMDCIDIHGFRVSPIGSPPEFGDVSLITHKPAGFAEGVRQAMAPKRGGRFLLSRGIRTRAGRRAY